MRHHGPVERLRSIWDKRFFISSMIVSFVVFALVNLLMVSSSGTGSAGGILEVCFPFLMCSLFAILSQQKQHVLTSISAQDKWSLWAAISSHLHVPSPASNPAFTTYPPRTSLFQLLPTPSHCPHGYLIVVESRCVLPWLLCSFT